MGYLGLDMGDKTIGVAASDELGWAHPVRTIRRRSLATDIEELREIIAEREPTRLVVGLPLNMDGSEGPRAAKTRRFAEALREAFGLPVILWDERLTTWEAEGLLREAGVKRGKLKSVIDAAAAQVILRSYLDAGSPSET
jgi:putative Holliday junction resolvase